MYTYKLDDNKARYIAASSAWLEELLPRSQVAGGRFSLDKIRVKVGGKVILHTHKEEEQAYLITKGRARIRIGDEEMEEVSANTVVYIPIGVENEMWNIGDEELEYFTFTYWLK